MLNVYPNENLKHNLMDWVWAVIFRLEGRQCPRLLDQFSASSNYRHASRIQPTMVSDHPFTKTAVEDYQGRWSQDSSRPPLAEVSLIFPKMKESKHIGRRLLNVCRLCSFFLKVVMRFFKPLIKKLKLCVFLVYLQTAKFHFSCQGLCLNDNGVLFKPTPISRVFMEWLMFTLHHFDLVQILMNGKCRQDLPKLNLKSLF